MSPSKAPSSDLVAHGGRLRAARALFPAVAEPWLDLSTGVSPWPYPAQFASPQDRARLPDPAEVADLEASAASAFHLEASSVLAVAVAGAESGIRLLTRMLQARRVAIVEPTYSGHRAAWTAAGADVQAISLGDLTSPLERFDAVVVVNPNNPDGRVIPPEVLVSLARSLGSATSWVIVDEAFIDQTPLVSVLRNLGSSLPPPGLISLRSFGKFYGLPGLRLGFLTGDPRMIDRLRAALGEWPISADALSAGRQAYSDPLWAEGARLRLQNASETLDQLLSCTGFEVLGGTSLYRLTRAADAGERFQRLAQCGVLTRPFSDQASWLRFGVPAASNWSRLEGALTKTALA